MQKKIKIDRGEIGICMWGKSDSKRRATVKETIGDEGRSTGEVKRDRKRGAHESYRHLRKTDMSSR